MKNIRDLFDTLSPAPEQTARMAARIDAEGAKNRRRPVRRMAAVLAAALLLAGGTVTAFAVNPDIAETVRQFFTREEILIDGKAQMIGQRDGENGIVLSVDKAFRDGNTVYLSCTLTNTEGVFEGYLLTTEELTVKKYTGPHPEHGRIPPIYETELSLTMGDTGIYAGEVLKLLPDEPTDTLELMLELPFGSDMEGQYVLAFDRLYTVEKIWDSVEDAVHTEYAESLEVTFDLGALTEALDVYEESPMLDIELFGGRVTFTNIRISPIEIYLEFTDLYGDTVTVEEYPDIPFSPIEYLLWLRTLREHPDVSFESYMELSYIYRPEVTFRDGVSAVDEETSYGWSKPYSEDRTEVIRLTNPIFPSDIEKISLVCEMTGDEIVIWEGPSEPSAPNE